MAFLSSLLSFAKYLLWDLAKCWPSTCPSSSPSATYPARTTRRSFAYSSFGVSWASRTSFNSSSLSSSLSTLPYMQQPGRVGRCGPPRGTHLWPFQIQPVDLRFYCAPLLQRPWGHYQCTFQKAWGILRAEDPISAVSSQPKRNRQYFFIYSEIRGFIGDILVGTLNPAGRKKEQREERRAPSEDEEEREEASDKEDWLDELVIVIFN